MNENRVTLFGNQVSLSKQRKAAATVKKYARKYHYNENEPYPLFAKDNPIIGPFLGVRDVYSGARGESLDAEKGIVIGTIRMGYGHYRIAMSVASAAHAMGLTPYWFDLLGFDSAGARLVRDLDYWYSVGSKLSQKSKLFNYLVWDPLMGKAYKRVEKNYPIMETCRLYTNVYKDLPESIPFLGTHPWLGQAAVHAGRTNVINMIPDNCPLGFHLADGALHTVQGPSMYMGFRALKGMGRRGTIPQGVLPAALKVVGHYVDHELVANIDADCNARVRRMQRKEPRRLLISIGGAGAQQRLIMQIVRRLRPLIKEGRVILYLNFGDHKNAWELFRKEIAGFENEAVMHSEWSETTAFAQAAINSGPGLHAFLHDNTFAAVYATNLLMRSSDILLTKPSELAYYPIPKLFLPRVGGHEAWGAIRSAELGDGAIECTDDPLTMQALDMMLFEDDLLELYCENIIKLNRIGIYNGAYRVIELACEGKNRSATQGK